MKIIKTLSFIFIFLLSACNKANEKIYYQLPVIKESSQSDRTKIAKLLWIKPIRLSDYLASSGLVYQTNDVRYTTAQSHLWASPLDQQLQQSLMKNLEPALPGWFVSTQSMNADQWTLDVRVDAFQGRYDGRVIISGVWLLQHHEQEIKQSFYFELKQEDDGYDTLVRTLGKGWAEAAGAMAKELNTAIF